MHEVFVSRVIHRARYGQVYILPEWTLENYVTYFDDLRIPERLEGIARCIDRLTPEVRPTMTTYIQEKESERQHFVTLLEIISKMFEAGDLRPDEYTRLTTKQDYTTEHRQVLSEQVNYFVPYELGVGCRGHHVFYLRTGKDQLIYLRLEGETWIHDDVDPFQGKSY